MHPKTKGRELALQYLYMRDVLNGNDDGFDSFLSFAGAAGDPPGADSFAKSLVDVVVEHGDEFDKEIADVALNWKVGRMSVIDRNILRVGIAELSSQDTGFKIVINEAVELAKKFNEPLSSPKFVNGILDKVRKNRDEKKPSEA